MSKVDRKIEPILYFGLNRNGTTWLGNVLVNKFGVAAAYSELNFGVCEVSLFKIKRKYGDFNSKEDYISFLEAYKTSDVFLSLEGDLDGFKKSFYKNFYYFFIELINEYTIRQNSKNWTLKIEPYFLVCLKELNELEEALKIYYSNYYFISIRRDFYPYFNSSIGLLKANNKYSMKSAIAAAIINNSYYKLINKFINKNGNLSLRFDKKKLDQIKTILSKEFNLEYTPQEETQQYLIQNSSKDTENNIDSFDKKCIFYFSKIIEPAANFIIKSRLHKRKFEKEILWKERIHLANTNPNKLIESLNGYSRKLIPYIRNQYFSDL